MSIKAFIYFPIIDLQEAQSIEREIAEFRRAGSGSSMKGPSNRALPLWSSSGTLMSRNCQAMEACKEKAIGEIEGMIVKEG